MPVYLVVANQTAESDELIGRLKEAAAQIPAAEFELLVPATPPADLLVWEEGQALEIAARRAESAARRLRSEGLTVTGATVGDHDPMNAVHDALGQGMAYRAIFVSTLEPGLSRWIRMDLLSRLRRAHPGHDFVHIVARTAARPQTAVI